MNIVKYILGFGIILGGIISISQGQTITGIFITVSGLLILPLVSDKLKTNFSKWKDKKIRYTTIIGLFIASFFFIDGSNYKPTATNSTPELKIIEQNPVSEFDKSYWNNYAPSVKTKIQRMVKRGNCNELQAEFDLLAKNDKAQKQFRGEGNAKLMDFIDKTMRELGCYE